jgi:hypothetical protein
MVNVAAQELGAKGGKATSEAKTKAARKNAAKPRGKWVTSVAFEFLSLKGETIFGCAQARGKAPNSPERLGEWVERLLKKTPGYMNHTVFSFTQLATTSQLIGK